MKTAYFFLVNFITTLTGEKMVSQTFPGLYTQVVLGPASGCPPRVDGSPRVRARTKAHENLFLPVAVS